MGGRASQASLDQNPIQLNSGITLLRGDCTQLAVGWNLNGKAWFTLSLFALAPEASSAFAVQLGVSASCILLGPEGRSKISWEVGASVARDAVSGEAKDPALSDFDFRSLRRGLRGNTRYLVHIHHTRVREWPASYGAQGFVRLWLPNEFVSLPQRKSSQRSLHCLDLPVYGSASQSSGTFNIT